MADTPVDRIKAIKAINDAKRALTGAIDAIDKLGKVDEGKSEADDAATAACTTLCNELEQRLATQEAAQAETLSKSGDEEEGGKESATASLLTNKQKNQEIIMEAEASEDRQAFLFGMKCVVMMIFYLFFWGLIFTTLEKNNPTYQWTYVDGWYFSILTIGTVGYGVLVPSSNWTRFAVVCDLTIGLTFSLYTMGVVAEIFLRSFEKTLEKTGLQQRKWMVFDSRGLGMSVCLFICISVGVIYGVMWEGWDFVISLYWTFATITTVGYGDFTPRSQEARLAMSFYILICSGLFAAICTLIIAGYLAVQKRAMAVRFLLSNLSLSNLALMAQGGNEVSRNDFHSFMLVKMGYVEPGVLRLINDAFDKLDTDGSNQLDLQEVSTESSEERQVMLEELRKAHGISEEDEHKTPLGLLGMRFRWEQSTWN